MSTFLHSYHINPKLTAFSTLRQGGKSSGAYESFNCNPFTGDDLSCVHHNRLLLSQTLNITPEQIIFPQQTHQTNTILIGNDFLSLSSFTQQMILNNTDALITCLPELCIGVFTADCVPLILFDFEHQAIGVVHAGWRGTVKRIVQNTLKQMHYAFQTKPQMVQAIIAPSISFEAFEVGEEVFYAFKEAGFAHNSSIVAKANALHANPHGFCLVDNSATTNEQKWHINLPECNAMQLEEVGVLRKNILFSNICTYTSHQQFFSARRLGTQSGRIFTGAMLAHP